ncbi:hypothetical protein BGX28_002257, partial [Mortierella sp. GBA30]
VAGIDLGEVVPCAVAALHAPTMNTEVLNAIITRRSMYESTEQFSRYLREAKSQLTSTQDHHQTATWAQEFFEHQVALPSIQDYESQMPERQTPEPDGLGTYARWFCLHELDM